MSSVPDLEYPEDFKHYNSNPKLRAANQKLELSEAHVKEWLRCKQDPMYFVKNYIKIQHTDFGLIDFRPRPFQKELLKKMIKDRFVIAKVSRQVGKTTSVVAYFLHQALFFSRMNLGVFADNLDHAKEILDKLKDCYEQLPLWMQNGIIEWNKQNIQLENNSSIDADTTTSKSGRSKAYNMILLDEFAHVDSSVAEEFFRAAYPTLSSGQTTKIIIISTPNGMNLFHKFWIESEKGLNPYKRISANWTADDRRDEEWKKKEIAVLGEDGFNQEHECVAYESKITIKLKTGEIKEIMIGELHEYL